MQASLVFLLKLVVQPTQRCYFYRMAECLSGRVMMPLEIRGPQNCCTSSMMLSGTWVGPLLQIFLQCPEETIKWVLLPQLLLLHVLFSEELGWDSSHCILTSVVWIKTVKDSVLLQECCFGFCFFFWITERGGKTLTPGKLLALRSYSLMETGNAGLISFCRILPPDFTLSLSPFISG